VHWLFHGAQRLSQLSTCTIFTLQPWQTQPDDNRMQLIHAGNLRRSTGDVRSLSRRYACGELVRVRRGVYASKSEWISLPPWERYRQTVLAVDLELPGSTFCLHTAAVAWGLNLLEVPGFIHLTGVSRGHLGRSAPTTSAARGSSGENGLELTTSYGVHRHPGPAAAVRHENLLVTPLAETVVGIIARENFAAGVVLADHALSRRHASSSGLRKEDLLSRASLLPSEARRRWVTQVLDFAGTDAESPGESLSRAHMHVLGFPAPLLQARVHVGGVLIARTDFLWPRHRLIGEFDGDAKYLRDEYLGVQTARQAVLAEKKREDRLRAAGFRIVRWDWSTASDPARLEACLRQAGLWNSAGKPGSTR
jgi:hypothetical protein